MSFEEWERLSPYFEMEEVISPDGLAVYHNTQQIVTDRIALLMLNGFRSYLGKPITVNSGANQHRGYRSPRENAAINGAADLSFHMQGKAFDISCKEISCLEIFHKARAYGWKGIGLYDTWVHVDNRWTVDNQPVTWDKRAKKDE